MSVSQEQLRKVLAGAVGVLVLIVLYRVMTAEKPRTAPLTYARGAVATSRVRTGIAAPAANADPVHLFLARKMERFPGVTRDIFRMENPAPPKPKPAPVVVSAPTPTVVVPPPPTPEELAAEASRAELAKFRFLGYLADRDRREPSLFLSKEGETFIVKKGDTVLRNYRVKEAGKDYVVLIDTVTRIEARIDLSGGAEPAPAAAPGVFPRRY